MWQRFLALCGRHKGNGARCGKVPRGNESLDAGFAIGGRSGGSACEESRKWRGYSAWQAGFWRRGWKSQRPHPRDQWVRHPPLLSVVRGGNPGPELHDKIVRIRKVFVAWVEKRAYIRKCRTLFCDADLIRPRGERDRLFSS